MPPYAMGSGTISFGLVTIPVKVYSANKPSESISFNLLHEKCGSRLKQQYWCQKCEEVVERADMAKGYEFSKNQYVLFSEDELKAIEKKSTQAIEITEFVPAEAVDPIYFDKTYYLGPDRHGGKPYHLLAEAMRQSGRWALARYTARSREYLVLLRPMQNGLVMQQLIYSNQVRPMSELGLEEAPELKEQELKLATMLADQVSSDEFHPEKYQDESREKLRALIEKKIQGQEITEVEEEEQGGKVIDLMEALRASLEGSGTKKSGGKKAAKTATERKPPKRAPKKASTATKKRAKK